MRTLVDEQLLRESKDFALRYSCEHCAHFDEGHGRCSLEYPSDEHRLVPLARGQSLVFCKEFDLV